MMEEEKAETRRQKLEIGKAKEKRDFSLRKPTNSQERVGKKKSRPAPFEMTAWWGKLLSRS